ncbi:MAG: thioesterase family protein [Nocardioidaceae bacterium]
MTSEFDRAIALTPLDPVPPATDRDKARFGAALSDQWSIGRAVNGGLLLALLGKAATAITGPAGHPHPLAVSAHYLSASGDGGATLAVETLRSGRGTSTVAVGLSQAGEGGEQPRVRALVTTGDLSGYEGESFTTPQCPQLPPPDQCFSTADGPPGFKKPGPFLDRIDVRLAPDSVGWALGQFDGSGVMTAWFRFPDDREPDPISLLQAVDALPPVTFTYGHFGWVPTLELTAYIRAVPAPGWLVLRHATRAYVGGLLEEDAEVWDSTGRLVAQSRQLASAPRSTATT